MNVSASPPAPTPHVARLGGALDRASAAADRAWTIVQSMTDGVRAGSSRLDDKLASIGTNLAVAGSHAARAGRAELLAPLGSAAQQAIMVADSIELPAGQTRYRPAVELRTIDVAASTLLGIEELIGDVRRVLELPQRPTSDVPARQERVAAAHAAPLDAAAVVEPGAPAG